MDRESLETWLEHGLSLQQIARRVGKDPSTVGYWVQKHGLEAVHRDRHRARGGIARETLEGLVESGASIAQIAEAVGRSKATVRHWLKRYDLQTAGTPGRRRRAERLDARAKGLRTVRSHCRRHGETDFVIEGRGSYRCLRCRTEAVVRRRRKVKEILVAEAGGACVVCGYRKSVAALHFHHVDPGQKSFGIALGGKARSIEAMREESRKCVLLCSNCHAEVESGSAALSA
jgi:transposase